MTISRVASQCVAVWCIAALASGCATNPAKNLEPNGVDVKVNDDETPQGLFRGDEELDEQDFYHLTGDVDSENAVKSSRSGGMAMQSIGVTLITIGAAAVAFAVITSAFAPGGLAGEQGLVPKIWPDDSPWLPYLIGAVGGGVIGLGSYLFGDGKAKTLGTKPIYDLVHAQQSIEVGRYGPGGLKPENITALELATIENKLSYCGYSGTTLRGIVANDKNGKEIKVRQHLDWLTWKTEPAGALSTADAPLSEDAPVEEGASAEQQDPVHSIGSPLRKSLSALGQPVTVTVTVAATGVQKVLTLQQDLSCFETVDLTGADGEWGQSGQDGQYGYSGGSGVSGASGGNGRDGQAGRDIEAEAAWVTDAKGRKLGLIAWTESGSTRATLVDPRGNVRINGDGGDGGRGGRGGHGGRGSSSDSGKSPRYCAGEGGNGGSGGTGGRGGNGGRVTLNLSDESVAAVVRATAAAGRAGSAGSAGRGGYGGSNNSACGSRTPRGGTDGTPGQMGQSGQAGSVSKRVVPMKELRLISQVLASNPSLKFAAGAGPAYSAPVAAAEPPSAPAAPAVDADEPEPAPVASAAAADSKAPKFKLAKSTFKKGEKIVLTFDRALVAPSGQQYWVTILDPKAPETEFGTWHYVPAKAKKDSVVMKTRGTYEVRLHDLYPQNSGKVLHRQTVTVK